MLSASSPRAQQVVLLNGPAGVGKTTIGRALAGQVRNGVCLHGDSIKNFVVRRDSQAMPTGLTYVGAAALTDVYLRAGYELVVFEFVFPRHAQVQQYLNALQTTVDVHSLTLWAPLDCVTEREAGRPGRERLGAQVARCWHDLAEHLEELGVAVDATAPTAEVVEAVRSRLDDGSARLRSEYV